MSKKTHEKVSDKPSKKEHKAEQILFLGSQKALIGGILAGSIALCSQWLIGQVYTGWEARQLLESVTSSALYLGGSVVTASATILALMLTMLGLTKKSNGEFDSLFFKRIERIGLLSTISLIAGVLLLLFLSVPVQKADEVPAFWYTVIYYILITFIAGLAGLVVSIVLMLLNSITSLIDVIRPTMEEDIADAEEREKNESEKAKDEIDSKKNKNQE